MILQFLTDVIVLERCEYTLQTLRHLCICMYNISYGN